MRKKNFRKQSLKEQIEINCPKCGTNNIRKNGHRRGKQNYQCKDCGRQFIEFYSPRGYATEVKEECLTARDIHTLPSGL